MRKLFRMKYESCSGQCYADEEVMRIHNLGLDAQNAAEFLHRLLAIHEPSCGNDQIAFRLDVSDDHDMYVTSFQRYGSLDLFMDKTALGAMNQLIDAAQKYYKSEEYKTLVTAHPGYGHGVCHHGDDKKLIDFAISFSGLSATEQSILRSQFA